LPAIGKGSAEEHSEFGDRQRAQRRQLARPQAGAGEPRQGDQIPAAQQLADDAVMARRQCGAAGDKFPVPWAVNRPCRPKNPAVSTNPPLNDSRPAIAAGPPNFFIR
jgi:hypothetical protein